MLLKLSGASARVLCFSTFLISALLGATLTGCHSTAELVTTSDSPSRQDVELIPSLEDQSVEPKSEGPFSVLINRQHKQLMVLDKNGQVVVEAPVGIGKGGLSVKTSMSDLVTPTGTMVVDLILYQEPQYNRVEPGASERFSSPSEFGEFFSGSGGLLRLFATMNSIDFDQNGMPDRAYGSGYIGLTSSSVITGPKMRFFQGTPYWFSIAIHGTPHEEKNIGQANSGGCVHVRSDTLSKLIEGGLVQIGTEVTITDG